MGPTLVAKPLELTVAMEGLVEVQVPEEALIV
jgi:hypothetical protein